MARKRMTVAEKKSRMQAKKRLQEKGILPPDKKPLNRKKFIEEVKREWEERPSGEFWEYYIMRAISVMLLHRGKNNSSPSLEAVGAAKVLKLTMKIRAFMKKKEEEGKKEYTIKEFYDYIEDVLEM